MLTAFFTVLVFRSVPSISGMEHEPDTSVHHRGMTAAFANHVFTASVWLINIPQLGHTRTEGTLEPCILNSLHSCSPGMPGSVVPNIHSSPNRTIRVSPRPSHVVKLWKREGAAGPLLLDCVMSIEGQSM